MEPGRPRRIFVPIANPGVDPSEVSIPWTVLTRAGHTFELATADGDMATPDRLMTTGACFGLVGARPDARACFARLRESTEWKRPLSWGALRDLDAYDAVFVPGGHMDGMRALAGDEHLQGLIRGFWDSKPEAPFAAMCHGVVMVGRSGVLVGRETTCFLALQELAAWLATFPVWGRWVRVFPRLVAREVRATGAQLVRAPLHLFSYGSEHDDRAAFVHQDGRYLSARWPGDAWLIARRLGEELRRG